MPKVTGVGGIFFKAENPESLYAWYEKHLGIVRESYGVSFPWRSDADPEGTGMTVWSIFSKKSEHFASSFMINYRVDDLDGLFEALTAEGIEVKREESEYGKFAWLFDPEGNKIELWQAVS
jgi:predicted enzyme related to lactoylglutathione lyase